MCVCVCVVCDGVLMWRGCGRYGCEVVAVCGLGGGGGGGGGGEGSGGGEVV